MFSSEITFLSLFKNGDLARKLFSMLQFAYLRNDENSSSDFK